MRPANPNPHRPSDEMLNPSSLENEFHARASKTLRADPLSQLEALDETKSSQPFGKLSQPFGSVFSLRWIF